MAIKSSHNTMTYRKPLQWWLRPLAFTARCQSRPYQDQDAEAWDLRIFFTPKHGIQFRHGFFAYDAHDFLQVLGYANDHHKHVRFLLENRSFLNEEVEKYGYRQRFRDLCEIVHHTFPNVRFYGGKDLYTGDVLYDFHYLPKEMDLYSSKSRFKIAGLWPWLWAKLHNKENLKELSSHHGDTVIHYDFL